MALFLLLSLAVPVAHARPGGGHRGSPGVDAPPPAGPGPGPGPVGPGGKPNIVGDGDDDGSDDGGDDGSERRDCSDTDLSLPSCIEE
jgi:hypothetical protein